MESRNYETRGLGMSNRLINQQMPEVIFQRERTASLGNAAKVKKEAESHTDADEKQTVVGRLKTSHWRDKEQKQ
jgi:hypothetical protein